jgi:hypothetical protein
MNRPIKHEGIFRDYDKQREIRLFADAMKNLSLDKPLKYQNVSPQRLGEIKDEVYDRIVELRKSAEAEEIQTSKNKNLLLKYAKIMIWKQLKAAFNKWKNTDVPQFGNKFNAYKEEIKAIYN